MVWHCDFQWTNIYDVDDWELVTLVKRLSSAGN